MKFSFGDCQDNSNTTFNYVNSCYCMFRSINTLNKKRKPDINSAVTIITATAMPSLEMFFILFIETVRLYCF